jgi:hypothetical protein
MMLPRRSYSPEYDNDMQQQYDNLKYFLTGIDAFATLTL